jgi:rare lipoprotein A
MTEMTAAHKNLPFGTMLKVTNLKNGREVWVRINDRLPQTSRRIIDLSKGAAEELKMVQDGIVKVKLEVPDEDSVVIFNGALSG